MGKFEQEAKDLLQAIGGKENVTAVTHCATRMRFVLGDEKKANVKAIESIPAVKGTFTNAGQFQVIIGNDVPIFYNDFTAVSGIEGVSKEAAKSAAKSNQNVVQRVMTTLAEIFTPIIPALIVGGLILGFRNVLEGVHWSMLDGKTITESSQFWAGVNHFLWLPGEAIFQFLPVGITWSVSRKMGTSQILGIVLGICLVSPQLLNAYAVASTSTEEIAANWVWNFGYFTVNRIGYQAQVIPALQAEFVAQEEAEFVSHEPVTLAPVEIVSPLTGQVKELSQATDPVFASGIMGQGLVIEPSQGELTSPVNGTVTVLFPTKHAIGIVSDEGVELLIHIGMDTVGLDGKGFESLVAQGDHVTVGQKLIRFDIDAIKAAGLVTETPVIITNQDAYTATITGTYPTTIQAGEALMVATRI